MASENQKLSSVALTPVEATDYAENTATYKANKRPFYRLCPVLVPVLVLP